MYGGGKEETVDVGLGPAAVYDYCVCSTKTPGVDAREEAVVPTDGTQCQYREQVDQGR